MRPPIRDSSILERSMTFVQPSRSIRVTPSSEARRVAPSANARVSYHRGPLVVPGPVVSVGPNLPPDGCHDAPLGEPPSFDVNEC